MEIYIALGKEMCFSLWEEDFARMVQLASNGEGDIVTYNTDRLEKSEIEKLLNVEKGQESRAFVNDDQMKIIKKLENNIKYEENNNSNNNSYLGIYSSL